MNRIEFEMLVRKLRKGDNTLLKRVFLEYRPSCLEKLTLNLGIQKEKAEDLFMDAMIVFRDEAIQKKVKPLNIKGYLYTIAYRVYLRNEAQKKILRKKITFICPSEGKNLLDEEKLEALNQAWNKMGGTCKNLLRDFYYEGIRLTELQEKYGYSSYESIKTTKKRCFSRLKTFVNEYYTQLTLVKNSRNEI